MARDAAAGNSGAARSGVPQVAVGAVCVHDGRLLVVERAHDPGAGRWSLPGGRVEAGETLTDALVREVAEETGLAVRVGALCGIAERIGDGYHFVIIDFWVESAAPPGAEHDLSPRGGTGPPALSPGDDSSAARWVTRDELTSLPLVAGLHAWLDEHGVLLELT